jgi:ATP phosphoribosyltransferase
LEKKRIKVAIAKGRILGEVLRLMKNCGYATKTIRKNTRELVFDIDNIRVLICKPADVPKYVELGAADCGLVGSDCIAEAGCDIYEPHELPIGKCKMVLACLKNKKLKLLAGSILTIGTKYPNITKEYFAKKKISPEIVYLNGSVELAPLVGLADAIVDITETGETIKKNNLKVVDVVKEVCCKLVVNKTSQKTVGKEIRFFISSLLK